MKAVLALNFISHSMEAGISYKISKLIKKYVQLKISVCSFIKIVVFLGMGSLCM